MAMFKSPSFLPLIARDLNNTSRPMHGHRPLDPNSQPPRNDETDPRRGDAVGPEWAFRPMLEFLRVDTVETSAISPGHGESGGWTTDGYSMLESVFRGFPTWDPG